MTIAPDNDDVLNTLTQPDTPAVIEPHSMTGDGVRSFKEIVYANPVGYRPLRMDVMLPPTERSPFPVVVWIHGGAFRIGSRRRSAISGPVWDALLDRGIAVASVEYRLSGEALFPACLHDVKAGVRWLRRYGAELGIDPGAVASWGESAGAHLSAFVGLNTTAPELEGNVGVVGESSEVRAALAWYPPTDFLNMDAQAGSMSDMLHAAADSPESWLIGAPLLEDPVAAAFASPISHVTARAAPMLLVHGLADRLVPHQQSVVLHDALRAVGADSTLELVPGAAHVFDGVDRAPIIARSVAFVSARLSVQ